MDSGEHGVPPAAADGSERQRRTPLALAEDGCDVRKWRAMTARPEPAAMELGSGDNGHGQTVCARH